MSLPAPERILAGFLLALGLSVGIAIVLLLSRPDPPPQISGVLLPQPRPLDSFRLLDQHGREFTNANLQGSWHLVSYGFTTCPDVCPTTLSRLAAFSSALGIHDDLQIVFYSVDFQRDTPEKLAGFLPYFHADIIGLTHRGENPGRHVAFEKGLGIRARLVPADGDPDAGGPAAPETDYQVMHGLTLFLLNPRGELQATFEPTVVSEGVPAYDAAALAAEYSAVRRYLQRRSS